MKKVKIKPEKLILSENQENVIQCFRDNIERCMDFYDLTIKEVANKADLAYGTLNTFLYDKTQKNCNLMTAIKLAKAFNVSIDDLVGCGTRNPLERESLSLYYDLPQNERAVVRWIIQNMHDNYNELPPGTKAVRVMTPKCVSGNIMTTNEWDYITINDIPSDIQSKIFIGFRIPCVHYMPIYNNGDVLLIASDRAPISGEQCVVKANNNLYIARCKRVGGKIEFYSIIRNVLKAVDSNAEIIGYIAHVVKDIQE